MYFSGLTVSKNSIGLQWNIHNLIPISNDVKHSEKDQVSNNALNLGMWLQVYSYVPTTS